MIIVEGTDLVGKTTVANQLVLRAAGTLNYKHYSRLPDDWDYYYDYLNDIHCRSVLDRFHMSEIAYAYARGEKPDVRQNPWWYNAIDRQCIAAGGMTVIITADEDLIRSRWGREEMYDIETVLRANEAFMKIANFGALGPFTPWMTIHFHCTFKVPFLGDQEIEFIEAVHQIVMNVTAFTKAHNVFPTPAPQA